MRARHVMIVLTTLLASLLATVATAGQVFEWQDASGRKHFSDNPPPGVEAKPIGVRTQAPRATTPPAGGAADKVDQKPQTWVEKNEAFEKRRTEGAEDTAKAEAEAAEEQRRQQACEDAREQLKLLQSGVRVQRMDANGERVVLDDAARAEEMARARENIEQACKP